LLFVIGNLAFLFNTFSLIQILFEKWEESK
jgi:hypothetical protein